MARQIRDYDPAVEEANPVTIRAFDRAFRQPRRCKERSDKAVRWYRLRYWDYTKKLRAVSIYSRYLRRFHFDFLEDKRLNAVASAYDDTYLVGCYRGAIENITSFFALLFSDPRVLPEIGDAERERRWIGSLRNCDWSAPRETILGGVEMLSPPPPDFPLDADRKLFAHRLAILAMDFLFFHEVGHLVNGHLEFVFDTNNSEVRALEEASFSDKSGLNPLDYQALEFNADTHAAIVMTRDWFSAPEALPEDVAFSSVTEAIQSLVLAMLAVFIMFDRRPSRISSYEDTRHPHPVVRLANVQLSTLQLASQHSSDAAKMIEQAWNAGFARAFQMCSILDVGSSVWSAAQQEMNSIMSSYEKIAERFTEIDPLLRPDVRR